MKISTSCARLLKLGFGLLCIAGAGVAYGFNIWRHPDLPPNFPLPPQTRVSYSVRFFNPLMTGPALYYRIESPQSQRATAAYFQKNFNDTPQITTARFTNMGVFEAVALHGSPHDTVLWLEINEQIFHAESETRGECRVWKTATGSTTEFFVWTNF